MRLINQGMILGEGGVKMSKSLGNVINPDDIITSFGADTMRVYEMFMGPLEVSKPWSTRGIAGVKRFLEKIWRAAELPLNDEEPSESLLRLLHKTIKKVSQDTGKLEFNTAIAQMMIFMNEVLCLPPCPARCGNLSSSSWLRTLRTWRKSLWNRPAGPRRVRRPGLASLG